MNPWVLNGSPLILFARIDSLDIVDRLAKPIMVPDAVIDEVRAGEADEPFTPVALAFAQPRRVPNVPLSARVASWDLGLGESQVIAQAIQNAAWKVLDALAARRCATTHQVPVVGSMGIILRAKRNGLVESAGLWIAKLRGAGMYVDDGLVHNELASIGE